MPTIQRTQRFITVTTLACAVFTGSIALTARPTILRADDIPTNNNGERHGRATLEHPNGETHVQATYREGLLHGTYREFSDAGQLILQAAFRAGQLHGRLERRTDTGQRLEIARYQDGRPEGARQVFRDGAIVLTEMYEGGERTAQEGDASADPGPPTFGIGTNGLVDAAATDAAPPDAGNPPADRPAPAGQRPEHQRDTSRKPNGYPHSIDDITRAFGRINDLRIEGNPDDVQALAIRQLIKYRLLSGIADPIVAYDSTEAHLAQRAAEICQAIGRMDHTPPNPGMPEDEYAQAAEGAERSNLWRSQGAGARDAIEVWMVDYGSRNQDEVGHRRGCLTPGLHETAYGHHEEFASLLVNGNFRDHVQYEAILFPGPGYQPVEYFDYIHRINAENLVWSLHLNPNTYQTPDSEEQLRFTMVRILPGGERLEVDITRVHIAELPFRLDAILFDPEIEIIEPGAVYEVTVEGLERRRRPYTLTYRVEFFQLGDED